MNGIIKRRYTYGSSFSIPADFILYYKFDDDLLDESTNSYHLQILETGYSFVNDRKSVSNSALGLTAGRFRTFNSVNLSSNDKISISFWIDSTSTASGVICEYSSDLGGVDNGFQIGINYITSKSILVFDKKTQNNIKYTTSGIGSGWNHILITIDRALGSNSMKVYFNNVSQTLAVGFGLENALSGNYSSDQQIHIGGRSGGAYTIGSLDDFRIYNRILNETERTTLYNE